MLFVREVLSRGLDPAVLPYLVQVLGVTRRLAERGMRDGAFRRVHPAALHLALVGSLVFFLATEKARRRAIDAGVLPPMPDFPEYLRYVEELTLRGLAPTDPLPFVRAKERTHEAHDSIFPSSPWRRPRASSAPPAAATPTRA